MRIEDMEKWTVDELKAEVVRLSEECENKQHEILDKNDRINELQSKLDEMCAYNTDLRNQLDKAVISSSCDVLFEEMENFKQAHQDDCITINQLHTALDVLVDCYANLRKIHGVS